MSVLEPRSMALSEVAPLHPSSEATLRRGEIALMVPGIDYDGLVDGMFHLIRQNATRSTGVLAHMLEVLTEVVSCEGDEQRVTALQRHANRSLGDAEHYINNPSDLVICANATATSNPCANGDCLATSYAPQPV